MADGCRVRSGTDATTGMVAASKRDSRPGGVPDYRCAIRIERNIASVCGCARAHRRRVGERLRRSDLQHCYADSDEGHVRSSVPPFVGVYHRSSRSGRCSPFVEWPEPRRRLDLSHRRRKWVWLLSSRPEPPIDHKRAASTTRSKLWCALATAMPLHFCHVLVSRVAGSTP